MSPRRATAATATALAALALGLGGCGETEGITRGGSIIGETLTVYSLLPEPGTGVSRDVVDGERLALSQAGGRAGDFKINFASLDNTAGKTGDELPGQVASATRQAIADAQVVAVIGDLDAESARTSVPLLNSAGILHVSPGVTYPGFTGRVAAGEPERFYPAGPRTFFPLAPDDVAQARRIAGAVEGRVVVEEEASPEGQSIGAALRAALGPDRLAANSQEADVAVYAGTDPENARGVVEGLLRENPELQVLLPPALAGSGLTRRARVRALRLEKEPDPGFARDFEAAFGRRPGPGAVMGHDAMRAVLDGIDRAGPRASNRQAVIDAFRLAPRSSPELYVEDRRGIRPFD